MSELENSTETCRARPMSPHLQIWRWHVTMATSILHRATGIGNFAGLLLFVWWLYALSAGEKYYALFQQCLGSLLGQIFLVGILASFSYHFVNGVRHLFFGFGLGLNKKTATITGWLVIIFGITGTIKMYVLGLWALAR